MIRLTDEEILKGVNDGGYALGGVLVELSSAGRREYQGVAQAQLKKFMEWGNEPCKDKTHSGDMPKRQCGFCWQALLEEVR